MKLRYFSNVNSIKQRNQGDSNTGIFSMGLAVFTICLTLVFFIFERATFNRLEKELAGARAQNQKMEAATEKLRAEKRFRELPENMASEAKKLGFVAPRAEQVINY